MARAQSSLARDSRSYSGALHLDTLNHARSAVCGPKADGMGAGGEWWVEVGRLCRISTRGVVTSVKSSRFARTGRALTRAVAHFGSARTVPRTRQFLLTIPRRPHRRSASRPTALHRPEWPSDPCAPDSPGSYGARRLLSGPRNRSGSNQAGWPGADSALPRGQDAERIAFVGVADVSPELQCLAVSQGLVAEAHAIGFERHVDAGLSLPVRVAPGA